MNYLETLKNITKDKKRKNENLVLLLILLVVLLISVNYIFSDKKSNSTNNNENIISNSKNNVDDNNIKTNTNTLENKLENVLSKISGISDVSVVLSYSNEGTQNIIYNTKEEEKEGQKTFQKEVAFNEDGGKKTAIVESVNMPAIEGAIVVAKGANSVDMKSRIASAISAVTNLPVYKIQVFEKGE